MYPSSLLMTLLVRWYSGDRHTLCHRAVATNTLRYQRVCYCMCPYWDLQATPKICTSVDINAKHIQRLAGVSHHLSFSCQSWCITMSLTPRAVFWCCSCLFNHSATYRHQPASCHQDGIERRASLVSCDAMLSPSATIGMTYLNPAEKSVRPGAAASARREDFTSTRKHILSTD